MNQHMSTDGEGADTVDFWWNGEELKTLQRQRREAGAVDRPGPSSARVIDLQRVDPNPTRPLAS